MVDQTRKVILLCDFVLRMRNSKRKVSVFAKDQAMTKRSSHTSSPRALSYIPCCFKAPKFRVGKGNNSRIGLSLGLGVGWFPSRYPHASTQSHRLRELWSPFFHSLAQGPGSAIHSGHQSPAWQLSGMGLWQGK